MKKITFLLVALFMFTACGEYQKVLNKGTAQEKYKMATKMYEAQKYNKALRLFEQITKVYAGKPQMERIQYMVAQSNFNEKNYALAGYYFKKFGANYPKSSKSEEAAYLSAYSYYKDTPRYSLDPQGINKAVEELQNFINKYPNSKYVADANKYYKESSYKLERKAFEIGKTYYRTAGYDYRNYRAAIQAFDNLLSDYLGTSFKEEALYYRFKAANDYALKSTERRKTKRIEEAILAYKKFKRSFPNSKFMEDSNAMLAKLKEEQKRVSKNIVIR